MVRRVFQKLIIIYLQRIDLKYDYYVDRSFIGTTPLAPPRISAEVRLAERRDSSERYGNREGIQWYRLSRTDFN